VCGRIHNLEIFSKPLKSFKKHSVYYESERAGEGKRNLDENNRIPQSFGWTGNATGSASPGLAELVKSDEESGAKRGEDIHFVAGGFDDAIAAIESCLSDG
jgi:hypothetical protein